MRQQVWSCCTTRTRCTGRCFQQKDLRDPGDSSAPALLCPCPSPVGRLHSLELPKELGDAAPLAAAGEVECSGAAPAPAGDRGSRQPADAASLGTAQTWMVSWPHTPGNPVCPDPAQPCHVSVGCLAGDSRPLIKLPPLLKSPVSVEVFLFDQGRSESCLQQPCSIAGLGGARQGTWRPGCGHVSPSLTFCATCFSFSWMSEKRKP